MKKITTLLFSLSVIWNVSSQTWNNIYTSAGTGEKVKLVESPDGSIYMAHRDFQTGKANVRKYSNNTWSWVGDSIFTPSGIAKLKLAVGTDNLPVIAFQDVGRNSQLSVMKFNGTSWDTVGTRGFSNFTGAGEIGLAVKGNQIFAAYQQYNQIKVWYWNSTQSTWATVSNTGIASTGFPGGCELSVIGNNLYVGYRDNNGRNVVRYTGANNPSSSSLWTSLGSTFNSSVSNYIRIVPILGRVMVTNKKSSNNKFDCDMFITQGNLWYNGGSTSESIQLGYYDVSSNNVDSTAFLAYVDQTDSGRIYSANINLTWSRYGSGLFTTETVAGEVATLYTSDRRLFTAYQTRVGSKIKVNQFCSGISNPTFTLRGDSVFCADTSSMLLATTSGSSYQWYKDGALIIGETNTSLKVTESGSYYYKITNTCGESDSSSAITLSKEAVPTPTITENNGVLETQTFGQYQWLKSGVQINGATSQSYTPTEDGQYSVAVTNSRVLCIGTSAEFAFTLPTTGPNSLNEKVNNLNIQVFPNPSEGIVSVKGLRPETSLQLLTFEGRKVELDDNESEEVTLDLSKYPKGIYFLHVIEASGTTAVEKIILR